MKKLMALMLALLTCFAAALADTGSRPEIPQGTLNAEVTPFTPGQTYAVYSAPSDTSFRAANGKALLSTNDWVQVFFEEDGYLLVQYAISRHQYRIGYIKADAVSNLSEVAEIGSWANYPAQVLHTSALTDDPLNSCGAVMTLTAGQQVTYLGQLGQEWAFVETTTAQGQRIRGFVELSDLNVTRPDDADDNLNG